MKEKKRTYPIAQRLDLPRQWVENLAEFAFISPWLIGFLAFTALPMLFSFYYSFTEYDIPGFLMLYPILWMVSNSFKGQREIFNSFSLVPQAFNLDNYIRGWKYNGSISFGVFFKNSFLYTSAATLGAVLASATIFSFYWRWDDFLGPLLYLNRPRSFTVSLALRMFADPAASTDWGAIFAMGTLSLIPVFLIFVVFQKYIVEGMVTTGIKS
jgi:multiple sugar transport system permease protein